MLNAPRSVGLLRTKVSDLSEYIEIETGKGADALERRPELATALNAARKANAPWSWPSWIGFRAMSLLSRP